MNIANDKALHQCTSCQMCAAVCPTGAISIDLDKNGFYRPTVNPEGCVDCSLCTTICYKFDNNVQETNSLDDETIYGASAVDKSIVKETTSGGIADILARKLISRGYKCIGVCYDTDKAVAYHKVAETEQDVIGFRGSKYTNHIHSLHLNRWLARLINISLQYLVYLVKFMQYIGSLQNVVAEKTIY